MAVLAFSDLRYILPDGSPVLTGLSLVLPPGRTGLVGANGSGKSTLLRLVAGDLVPRAGRVVVDGQVAMLRQTADAAAPVAALFGKAEAMARLRRAEAGRATAEDLAKAEWDLEPRLAAALSRVGLEGCDPMRPLGHLSGGQRVRASLAAVFFGAPDLVLLDEPTNDLDADGRRLVAELLAAHSGAALVASHERALLESMDHILALEAGQGRLVGGGWSAFAADRASERARAEARLARAERDMDRTEARIAEAARRRAGRARVGKAIRRDGSQGKMLMDAARQRAENAAQGAARLAERQRDAACREAAEARAALAIEVPRRLEAGTTGRDGALVLEMRDVDFAYPGGRPVIEGLSLEVRGAERVAVDGPNGCGKSTLLTLAAGSVRPCCGILRRRGEVAFLDQQARVLGQEGRLAEVFAQAHPGLGRNAIHAALARMGFRGDAGGRPVAGLSGGERVQAALALVLAAPAPPALLILDEPTNHLDIATVETVEAGLRAYGGALLLVSHDAAFRQGVGITRAISLPPIL